MKKRIFFMFTVVMFTVAFFLLMTSGCGSGKTHSDDSDTDNDTETGGDAQTEVLSNAAEAWELNDGGSSGLIKPAVNGGVSGTNKWGVWLNSDTFGQVLDFSTEGAGAAFENTKVNLNGDFAISSWVLAPERENSDRTVLSIGEKTEESGKITYSDYKQLDSFETANWTGGKITLSNDAVEGEHSIEQTLSSAGDMVFCKTMLMNLSDYAEDGYLHIRIYVDNASRIKGGQFELTSSGKPDVLELSWNIIDFELKNGWNDIYIGLDCATEYGGKPILGKLNYVRLYFNCSDKVTVRLDDFSFCKGEKSGNAAECARLYLDAENGFAPALNIPGITGLTGCDTGLADGKWHHVLVTRKGSAVEYYIDGKKVKTCTISGSPAYEGKDICIGNTFSGDETFDGSIAQVRIYAVYKTPEQVTDIKINDNEYNPETRLKLNKGLVFDRRQYYTPRPGKNEGQTVTKDDIINAMNMGFDHVKLLLTPNHLIAEDGSLITENMTYITEVVNYVVEFDYVCYICIHPEKDFKAVYLGNLDNFELLCKWYGELAAYIGERWDADHVGLQLMTEPFNNSGKVSWSWMSDRMWGAVRNVLPDHTILTSSDSAGNIERLKLMSPATDTNLIYTFTTYEPYTIGWYWYGTYRTNGTFWKYIKDIPYPVKEGVDYTAEIEKAIELVPDSMKSAARSALTLYVKGIQDGDAAHFPNNYDSLYNADWHMERAKSLADWRDKYGGNLHIMCVEFGCMDALTGQKMFGGAAGSGIPEEDRIQYITDICDAFEKYGIGWSYWSYNEAHTVFKVEDHVYGVSPSPDDAYDMFDYDLLENALGVTPRKEK